MPPYASIYIAICYRFVAEKNATGKRLPNILKFSGEFLNKHKVG